MFNFPNTPSLGDAYQPVGGPMYQWDGQKWLMTGAAMIQTPAYNQRNRFVNGAFQISQENGNTGSAASGYYPADQWITTTSTLTGAITATRTIAAAAPYPGRLNFNCTTAQASLGTTGHWAIGQKLEGNRFSDFGWGGNSARSAVLRIRCNVSLAGIYSVVLRNPGSAQVFLGSFTIAPAEVSTNVEKIVSIPAPPTGATWPNDNTVGMEFYLTLAAASNAIGVPGWQGPTPLAVPGQVNFMSSTSNGFILQSVGLYLDPNNTGIPPAWEMPDEAQELAACQRYWRSMFSGDLLVSGYMTAGGPIFAGYPLVPPMRVTPTHAFTGSPTYSNASGINVNGINSVFVRHSVTVTAAGSAYGYSAATLNARM